jgi:hypothetical protein
LLARIDAKAWVLSSWIIWSVERERLASSS